MKYKKIIIILLPIIILIIIFSVKFNQKNQFDDIFFIKVFSKISNSQSDINSNNQFQFNIKYKNTKLEAINLMDTADKRTLVHEKIAPGTQGNFSIIMSGNKKSKYSIKFKSLNEKPKNLKFSAFSDGKVLATEKSSLEELSKFLNGELKNNRTKIIIINWYWNYENTENENMQDTEDSKNLKQYQFDIYTQGEEI